MKENVAQNRSKYVVEFVKRGSLDPGPYSLCTTVLRGNIDDAAFQSAREPMPVLLRCAVSS